MIGQFCDTTIGKECGLNESSHLLGRSLRDETKAAVKETSIAGMVCFFICFDYIVPFIGYNAGFSIGLITSHLFKK